MPYTRSRVPPPYVRPAKGSPCGMATTRVLPAPYATASACPYVGPLTATDAPRAPGAIACSPDEPELELELEPEVSLDEEDLLVDEEDLDPDVDSEDESCEPEEWLLECPPPPRGARWAMRRARKLSSACEKGARVSSSEVEEEEGTRGMRIGDVVTERARMAWHLCR